MSSKLFELTIEPMLRSLKNLDAIIGKAEVHVEADKGIDAGTLVFARLYPHMAPFIFQIRVATDTAKGAVARLTGKDVPAWTDEEKTFGELHERIGNAVDYLSSFTAQDFEGAEDRPIELKLGPRTANFDGKTYVTEFVVPNFYFHVTTAYNILRHNGVAVGKPDFLGKIG